MVRISEDGYLLSTVRAVYCCEPVSSCGDDVAMLIDLHVVAVARTHDCSMTRQTYSRDPTQLPAHTYTATVNASSGETSAVRFSTPSSTLMIVEGQCTGVPLDVLRRSLRQPHACTDLKTVSRRAPIAAVSWVAFGADVSVAEAARAWRSTLLPVLPEADERTSRSACVIGGDTTL
jgi:hypothetical protein